MLSSETPASKLLFGKRFPGDFLFLFAFSFLFSRESCRESDGNFLFLL